MTPKEPLKDVVERAELLDRMLSEMPAGLRSRLTDEQAVHLILIANENSTVAIEGLPVRHLHAALNAMLLVLGTHEIASEGAAQLIDAANGFTGLLDNFHPGLGAGYQGLLSFYASSEDEEEI